MSVAVLASYSLVMKRIMMLKVAIALKKHGVSNV
jgi:hypothetical protein